MFPRKIIYVILFLLMAISLILGGIIYYSRTSQELKVIFFDVGQGDAILIQQGNQQLLIDGGRNGRLLLEKLGRYVPFWDRQIEVMIATHPDADHIGGLIEALRNYRITTIIATESGSDSQTYRTWINEAEKEKAQIVEAMRGVKISFENGAVAEVIYPLLSVTDKADDSSNGSSVAVRLDVGEDEFLLGGDLPAQEEEQLEAGDIDILKVSHHGSKYSTSEKFLESVKPEEAIISVGKNNTYGHPAPEVIERLKNRGTKILRTDESGDIVYICKTMENRCVAAY